MEVLLLGIGILFVVFTSAIGLWVLVEGIVLVFRRRIETKEDE